MTMKKKVLTTLSVVLILGMAAMGILAYLTSQDSDVNVMTLGNVEIEQIEQERVDTSKLPTEDGNLKPFSSKIDALEHKPLFPAVFSGSSIPWDTASEANQAWKVVEDNANVVDKFVTVKNTGKSPAYVRTLVAYEGDATYGPNGAYIHVVTNGTNVNPQIPNNFVGYINIEGVDYTVYEYVYPDALAKGDTSIPSLKQVYMNNKATNEVVAKYGETYEILVLSQAVQAQGFKDAKTALDTGFGKVTEVNAKGWFEEILGNPVAKVTVLNKNDTIENANKTTILDKGLTIDTTGSRMGLPLGKLQLDTAYQFEPTMTLDEGSKSEYADWHADFVVSVDKDIPAYGIGLAGYYDAWCSLNDDKWVMLASDAEIPVGTEIRLVDAMGGGGITVSYKDLCEYGNDGIGFLCGAVALVGREFDGKTVDPLTPGTTLTVELRLYEATGSSRSTETGEYITTGVYKYTFK